ncbi:MAG: DUF935 domain-containing protein [Xanthomonadales bacterium]|nr:DUF935 domain-containing protein [Xanthomonadales bacterium]
MIVQAELTKEQADLLSDPQMINIMAALPNPDPILRKMGASQDVYEAIKYDPHVVGDLQSITSSLLSSEFQIIPGGDDSESLRLHEVAQALFKRRPDHNWRWPNLIEHAFGAKLYGYSVTEVVWSNEGGLNIPQRVIPRPQRRFLFTQDHKLRLVTKDNQAEGIEVRDHKYLVTRHKPEPDNPYGLAILSSLFWPWTFKHSGFRFFAKFVEKFGIPWTIGKHPLGQDEAVKAQLLAQLRLLVEDAIAAIPEGTSVELVESKSGGHLPHREFIGICNREMSKALTSQTLGAEMDGQGSRAATETHQERQVRVEESTLELIADHFNQMFESMRDLNFPNASPPEMSFVEEQQAGITWGDAIEKALDIGLPVSDKFARERMNIAKPEAGETLLVKGGNQPDTNGNAPPTLSGFTEFQRFLTSSDTNIQKLANTISDNESQAQIERMIRPVLNHIEAVGPEVAINSIGEMYPNMNHEELRQTVARFIFLGELIGRVSTNASAD